MSYDSDDDRVFVEFPKSLVNALNIGLDSLMDETNWMGYISLTPLKILNSNAADCHEGFPFSKAYCCTEKYSTQYSFGSVFRTGISMLIEFMLHRTVPDNKQEKFVLSKLLHYLFDYLDTGNWMVWHGNVDVIINNEVVIGSQDVEEKDCSPGGKSPVEGKLKSNSLSRNPQVIAQNIVFSFLQKHRHPESENFLFPCIGVTGKDMIVYFYDSMHDVLLESTLIPLHGMIPSAVSNINLVAIVVSWLVVNYKYLCDGVMEEMKTMKAEFFSQAEAKLAVYKFDLKAGDVGNSCPMDDSQDKVKNFHHPFLMDLKKRKRMVVLEPSER
ncbi:uncharacterized protein LOC132562860 isoform X2 [Ylistrum balloti]|uniref:uncharacterized protein LOC132562860 isoform X2 n=1 Tax=Ylistrum balloti TaxID=509963 RepID=UPI002905C4B4|nr:uncharacterized protein LOC132562860 isoform X2 [Ylistrum balloti]